MTNPDVTDFSQAPPQPTVLTQVAVTKEVDFDSLVEEIYAALGIDRQSDYISITLLHPQSEGGPKILSIGRAGSDWSVDEVKAIVDAHNGPEAPAPAEETPAPAEEPRINRDPALEPTPAPVEEQPTEENTAPVEEAPVEEPNDDNPPAEEEAPAEESLQAKRSSRRK